MLCYAMLCCSAMVSGGDGDSSDEGEGEMFSQVQKVQKMDDCLRAGYLDKRGKRNTGWKKRWFVLQADQLYYFKSHEHASQLGYASYYTMIMIQLCMACIDVVRWSD
jgi:hypothetical protein